MSQTISTKGWVVIPADLRRKYHLNPGAHVQIVDYGGVLALVPVSDDPAQASAGMLYDPNDSLTDALLAEHGAARGAEREAERREP